MYIHIKIHIFVVAISIAILYYLLIYYVNNSWHFQSPLSLYDFDLAVPMNKKAIPVTYYEPGKLQDVLPNWDHLKKNHGNSYIHLFRIKPGENFTFDIAEAPHIRDTKVDSVSQIKPGKHCNRLQSTLCKATCDTDMGFISIGEILNRSRGLNIFSSFHTLKDSDLVLESGNCPDDQGVIKMNSPRQSNSIKTNIYDRLFPSFADKQYELIHAFVSNFQTGRVSTSVHSNAVTKSVAIQLLGSKSWIFYPPEVYLGADGLASKQAKYSHYPTHSPRRPYDYYLYTSQPGDLLFFCESWGHSVYTHPGPNFMINYRKRPDILALLWRDPLALRHYVNFNLFKENVHVSFDITVKAKVLLSMACDGRLSHWDQQQLDALLNEAETFAVVNSVKTAQQTEFTSLLTENDEH